MESCVSFIRSPSSSRRVSAAISVVGQSSVPTPVAAISAASPAVLLLWVESCSLALTRRHKLLRTTVGVWRSGRRRTAVLCRRRRRSSSNCGRGRRRTHVVRRKYGIELPMGRERSKDGGKWWLRQTGGTREKKNKVKQLQRKSDAQPTP